MEILVVYVILAAIVGVIAGSWGRSGILWFLLSAVFSPLIGLIILLVAGRADRFSTPSARDDTDLRVHCDQCHELILPQAKVCKHCSAKRDASNQHLEPLRNPERTATAVSFGYQMGRLARKPLTWVIIAVIASYFIFVQQSGVTP